MMHSLLSRQIGQVACALVVFACLATGKVSSAADPAFVGVLALAVDEDGARRLELSDETLTKLLDLIDERESAALELALQIRDLPPSEQARRLAPFVDQSEQLGMELLTLQQRSKLQQLRISRTGMSTLAEADLATALDISDEQKTQINELLTQRAADMAGGDEQSRRLTRAVYERRLAAVLSEAQLAAWKAQAGLAAGRGVVVAQNTPPADEDKPAEVEPAEDGKPAESDMPAAEEKPADSDDAAAEKPAAEEPAAPTNGEENTPADKDDAKDEDDGLLHFNFDQANWDEVLQWFASENELSLQLVEPPPGTFNYRDPEGHTRERGLDLINSFLLPRGYTLLQRERALMVINLADPIPQEYFELVPVDQLKDRADYELMKCLFPLGRMTTQEAQDEFGQMLEREPFRLIPMPKSRQILVTGTGYMLKTIRNVIETIEDPGDRKIKKVVVIKLEHASTEEVMAMARPLLQLDEDETSNDQIRIAADPLTNMFLLDGEQEAIDLFQTIVTELDKATTGTAPTTMAEVPYLRAYPIFGADLMQVDAVLQTQLAGRPDVHMTLDQTSQKLIVKGRAEDHKMVDDTLALLQGENYRTEVIALTNYDPSEIVLMISELFGLGATEDGTAPAYPKVDGNPTTGQLFVRGTQSQIDQIKAFIDQVDPPPAPRTGPLVRSNVRLLPLTPYRAESALGTAAQLLPLRIHLRDVTPARNNPLIRERNRRPPAEDQPSVEDDDDTGADDPPPRTSRHKSARPVLSASRARDDSYFVSQFDESDAGDQDSDDQDASEEDSAEQNADADGQSNAPRPNSDIAEVRYAITPAGLVIASDDLDALDQVENLLNGLVDPTLQSTLPDVFPLKYAKADMAKQILDSFFTGGTLGGGGSLIGDLAGEAMGGVAGGLLSSVIGGSATEATPGSPSIIADTRLNVLIVQAAPTDLELISLLVDVIDSDSIGDVETRGKPRRIRLFRTLATEVAEVIKQAYPDRQLTAQQQGQGQQRQQGGGPEGFLAAAFGGGGRGGGGRGGGNARQEDLMRMTIAVDERTNSLYITAPDPLFKEVEAMVMDMDQAVLENRTKVSVLSFGGGIKASVMQSALTGVLGDSVSSSGSTSTSAGSSGNGSSGGGAAGGDEGRREAFLRAIQQRFGGEGGGPGGPGFGGRGGDFGGRGSGGPGGRGSGGRGGGDRGGGRRGGR